MGAAAAQNLGVGLQWPYRGKQNFCLAVNCHKREVTDIACGTKSRRGTPAALLGAGVWREDLCDGAHCPSTARRAAHDNIFPMFFPDQAQLFQSEGWLHQHHHHQATRTRNTIFLFSLGAISDESPL
jgi:hypothetical protein